jgi:hypothetical protein
LDFENPLPWLLLLHSSPSEFWTIYNEFPVQDVPQYGTRNWLCAVDTRSLGLIGEQFMSKLPLDLLTHIDKLRGIDVYKILQWLSHGSWEKKWAILKFNPMLAMAYSLAKTGFQKWDVCVQEEFKLFLSKVPLEHFRKSVLHNIFCAFQSKLGIEAMREYGSQSWFIDDLLGGKPVELLMEVVQKSKGDIEKRSEMLKQVRDLWKVVQRIRQRSGIHPRRPLCSFKDLLDYYRHAVREWEPLLWNGGAYSDKEIPVPWSDKYQTSTLIPIKTVRQWDICADLIGVHSVRSIEHEFPALARVGVYAYYQNTDFPQIILVEEKQPLAWQRRGWMSLGHWYWWNGKFF